MSDIGLMQLVGVNGPKAKPPTVGLMRTAELLGDDYLIDGSEYEVLDGTLRDSSGRLISNPQEMQVRWVDGYRYLPETVCGPTFGTVRDICDEATQLAVPANLPWVVGVPVILETGETCSAFGWEAHNYEERATRRLLSVESKLLANEFWTGTVAQAKGWTNQWLAAGGAVETVYATAQTPGAALALLEGALGKGPGAPGGIYCSRQLGAALSELGQTFRNVNGLIQTYMGSTIIPDAGFPGTGPTGQAVAEGSQWAFATLLPQVRRSAVELYPDNFYEALDRSTNTVTYRALRVASVSFDPCILAAVNVNLPLVA